MVKFGVVLVAFWLWAIHAAAGLVADARRDAPSGR